MRGVNLFSRQILKYPAVKPTSLLKRLKTVPSVDFSLRQPDNKLSGDRGNNWLHWFLNKFITFALVLLVLSLSLSAVPAAAQTQCGFADSVRFPVDTSTFRLVQDFGAPSPRHQGRYHTGEDWYGGRGSSYGQPVMAAAAGRVTFSSSNAWGRDGGVIIIEHVFRDSSVAYSMYGHVTDATGIEFPAVFTCVQPGDIIAAVGDIRPAPHLHFEIRTENPNLPGPGYSLENPEASGWRRPSKFVLNMQTQLSQSFLWRANIADETGPITPPIQLEDYSLVFLDANRAMRASSDGRILWRAVLERPAVGLLPSGDSALIVYADGQIQPINRDGTLGQSWQTGLAFDSAPMPAWGVFLLHTPQNELVALDAGARTALWRLSDVPPVLRWAAGETLLGLMTQTNEMLTISQSGQLLDRASLREPGALALSPTGTLMAYTRGGLWTIADDGTWTLESDIFPQGGSAGALAFDAGGTLYLFDGSVMRAYAPDRTALWQSELPGITGTTALSVQGNILLLVSSAGHIAALQAETGAVCNRGRIWGDWRSKLWYRLNDDGVLRIYVADQIVGLDWQAFLAVCG